MDNLFTLKCLRVQDVTEKHKSFHGLFLEAVENYINSLFGKGNDAEIIEAIKQFWGKENVYRNREYELRNHDGEAFRSGFEGLEQLSLIASEDENIDRIELLARETERFCEVESQFEMKEGHKNLRLWSIVAFWFSSTHVRIDFHFRKAALHEAVEPTLDMVRSWKKTESFVHFELP